MYRWSQIADMNEKRFEAACAVYEGKIVVTGSRNLNSVEAYDYYENQWTYLPDMNEKRWHHALVSMGNKLFVIAGYKVSTCELFDIYSRKFSYVKKCSDFTHDMCYFEAVCIDNCIVIFGKHYCKNQTKVFTYNDDTDEWKLINCSFLKNKSGFSCIKYHR